MTECPRCRMKRLGMNHNTAHSPGCPNSIPFGKRNIKTCPICKDAFFSSGNFPNYCKPCFDRWSD